MWHLATWTFMATTKHFSVTFSLKTRHTHLRRIRSQKRIRDEREKSALAMASTASTVSWSSSWLNSLGGNLSEATKLSDRRTALVVFAQKKATKTRKIILKEDVADLGKIGQLLDVKAGYYRNYLLPMGKAKIVTPALLKEMRMEEERIEAEKTRAKDEAQQLALSFETVGAFKVRRKGGKGKQIFGSVTAQDLVDIIKAQLQRDVDKRIVSLPEIRETGEYIAELRLHPEVIARVRLTVYAN